MNEAEEQNYQNAQNNGKRNQPGQADSSWLRYSVNDDYQDGGGFRPDFNKAIRGD